MTSTFVMQRRTILKTEKLREEVNINYKWDLSLMYNSIDDWFIEYKKLDKKANDFLNYKGKSLLDSNNLLNILDDYIALQRGLSKLYVFANMKSDENTLDVENQKIKGKAENLNTKILEVTSFLIPELIKVDYNEVEECMAQNSNLKQYERMIKEIFRYKNHILSEDMEKILSSLSKILNIPTNVSNLVTNADLKFESIKDENNNLVAITNSNYNKYIKSVNRDIRKNAFYSLYGGYKSVINTLAETLASEVEKNNTIASIRGYKNALEHSLFDSNISSGVYLNLIKTVNDNLDEIHKYYKLKKDTLQLTELTLYDVHVPIVRQQVSNYSFKEARQIITDALSIFGTDYIKVINMAFSEKWIDIYPNKGKKSGAYSWGCYDSPPYILMNYQNKLDDVSTLIHELGHSIHSYFSSENNKYQDSSYKIFVAEVASLVNELILYDYMLENTNCKKTKINIIESKLELFKNTLFRQTMFAEFEISIHQKALDNEILTNELFSQIYYQLNDKYFGNDVFVNDEIKYEWARIPHFYRSFYVYQYATGLAAACTIVNNIKKQKDNAIENYLKFLKSGNSDHPLELLKIVDVDLTKAYVIENAVNEFSDTLDQFEYLIKNRK